MWQKFKNYKLIVTNLEANKNNYKKENKLSMLR